MTTKDDQPMKDSVGAESAMMQTDDELIVQAVEDLKRIETIITKLEQLTITPKTAQEYTEAMIVLTKQFKQLRIPEKYGDKSAELIEPTEKISKMSVSEEELSDSSASTSRDTDKPSKMSVSEEELSDSSASTSRDTQEDTTVLTTSTTGSLPDSQDLDLKNLSEKLSKMSLSEELSDSSASTSRDTEKDTTALTTSTTGSQPDSQDLDLKTLSERVDAFLLHKDEYSSSSNELQMHGQEIENLLIKNKDTFINEDKIIYWLKLGQLFSVTKKNKQLAIEPLSKVVKLNPNIKEAWNVLADCYWYVGDYIMAQKCLETSLEQERTKEPLRNLSVIYRKLAMMDSERKVEFTETGVRLAKEAVNKDLKDSISWGILGNAYLHAYFNLNNDVKSAQLAISAYKQAVKLNICQMNTELYYNQALANKYCEFYQDSLVSLDMAIKQEKVWEPAAKLKCQLLAFLNNVQFFYDTKGKLRPKRISKFQKELINVQVGPCIQSLNMEITNINGLKLGKNENVFVCGKVIWTLSQQESFPFTCGCLEASGECFVVLVYNVTPGKGFIIGDTLFIPEPNYKNQNFQYDTITYRFPSIRVDNPTNLILNKKWISVDYFTPYTLITSEKEAT